MRRLTPRCGRGLRGNERDCPGRCGCWSGRSPRRECLRACAGLLVGRACRSRHFQSSTFATRLPRRNRRRWSSRFGQFQIRRARRLRRHTHRLSLWPSPASPPRLPPSARPCRRRHPRPRPSAGPRRRNPPFGGPRLAPCASSRSPCASKRSRTARPPPRSPCPRVSPPADRNRVRPKRRSCARGGAIRSNDGQVSRSP
jgi:hypothetical protein